MPIVFEVSANQLDAALDKLERGRREAVPFAIRQSLNATAFLTKREWTATINQKLVVRNTWTQRGILTHNATGTDIDRMESVVGSTREYMARLEEGGSQTHPWGVPIHTSAASGEGRGVRPRRKPVRPSNRLNKIRRYAGTSGNQKQRNFQAVREAMADKGRNKVAYLEIGTRKGLFKVTGRGKTGKLELIIDVSRTTTRTPPQRTLTQTLGRVVPRLPTLHALAIVKQLRRHGLMD